MKICKVGVAHLSLLVVLCGCGRTQHRPSNVPASAVWVDGTFIDCSIEGPSHANRCTIYDDKSGQVLLAGLFVLSGAGREARPSDLRYEAFDGKSILLQDARSLEPVSLQEWAVPSRFVDKLVMLAGNEAMNCGWVKLGQNPNSASDCALLAFRQKKPFYISYDAGAWQWISEGLAGNSAGDVYYVEYAVVAFLDLIPPRSGVQTIGDNHIRFGPCPKPSTLTKTDSGRLTCFQPISLVVHR